MDSIICFVKSMWGKSRVENTENSKFQNTNSPTMTDKRSEEQMKYIMSNEELIHTLKLLKSDGISYRYIARKCDIKDSTFYNYINRGSFPIFTREVITDYINNNLAEIVKNNV